MKIEICPICDGEWTFKRKPGTAHDIVCEECQHEMTDYDLIDDDSMEVIADDREADQKDAAEES